MLQRLLPVLIFGMLAQTASAAIVCSAATSFGGVLKLTLDRRSAILEVKDSGGAPSLTQRIPNTVDTWDGHMTGLITAPGLAVRYENQYGCIRNVTIIANTRSGAVGMIEELKTAGCLGGTTPDDLCFPGGIQ